MGRFPKLKDMAFDVLKKSQADYLKKNGLFSTDIFSISADDANQMGAQIQAASDIGQRIMLEIFLQAVIDNDIVTVKKCLDAEPELLIAIPDKTLVIECKLTWQKFHAEGALKMAAQLKQIKMVEMLLPYYDNLEQTDEVIKAKREALSAWNPYEIRENAEGEDEIIIPKDYADFAQSLIDVFKDETFPNGVPGVDGVPYNIRLSEKTESALSMLLETLVPEKAIKLDEHVDVELLLLAIYKAYVNNFQTFNYDWDKLDALCIRGMGLVLGAFIAETGEIFCEGLYDVVMAIQRGEAKKISPQALAHKLKSGEDFYRDSRASRVGPGAEFLCGVFGRRATRLAGTGLEVVGVGWLWKNYVKQKQQIFGSVMQQLPRQPDRHPTDDKRSGCVIL